MDGLLALTPVLIAIALLVCRLGSWIAALAGVLSAVLVVLLFFPTPVSTLLPAGADYLPIVVEVALILLFGMILARLLEASGAMHEISTWVQSLAPSRPMGVALVVFGIVPFAESVTGFGIGVTIGVPVLRLLGCTLRQSAILGLLGLIAVPWGALGPGTTVAAALVGVDVDALGLATAWINAIAVGVVVIGVLLVMRPSLLSALGILAAAVLLWLGILAASAVIGMAPAGIIGSLLVIVCLGAVFAAIDRRTGLTTRLGRAVLPYGVLTLGLLLARALAGAAPSPVTAIIASPPFWLAVACLIAAPAVPRRRRVTVSAMASWWPIGLGTAAFMVLGWLMTTTGMSTAIGELLPADALLLAPWLTTIGAVVTGSNTGSNSMFAGTLDALASTAGASTILVVAGGNVAGSLAAPAAPPRVAMAAQLAGDGARASAQDIGWVQTRALIAIGINAVLVGAWLQVFA